MQEMDSLYLPSREQWRAWLAEYHLKEKVIWLEYYKKHTGKPSIPYNDAVEEALCYGWIDSTVRRIDGERYMQKFTPRNKRSNWSKLNVKRVKKLIKEGKMTPAGLELFEYAKKHKLLPDPALEKSRKNPDTPDWFEEALEKNPAAREYFHNLAPSYKRQYLWWILDAKKAETRLRRLGEALDMLSRGEKLGMK